MDESSNPSQEAISKSPEGDPLRHLLSAIEEGLQKCAMGYAHCQAELHPDTGAKWPAISFSSWGDTRRFLQGMILARHYGVPNLARKLACFTPRTDKSWAFRFYPGPIQLSYDFTSGKETSSGCLFPGIDPEYSVIFPESDIPDILLALGAISSLPEYLLYLWGDGHFESGLESLGDAEIYLDELKIDPDEGDDLPDVPTKQCSKYGTAGTNQE